MELTWFDWSFIFGFFALALVIGIMVARQSGKSSAQFFLSGRGMPWWLLGFSMVATTFSTDTPNLVTDIVRKNGVAGNWCWWAFLLTGMLTVFVYARLWRRSKVLTDVEFYEIRYSGKAAAFLRGFRAIYLGVFFNIMIMGAVSLAAIKIGGVILGLEPWESIVYAGAVTVVFSTLGGFKGVILTDFFLFITAMIGAVAAAVFAVDKVGGLDTLFTHPNVADKLSILPQLVVGADGTYTDESWNLMVSLLVIPLAVQWWSVWYPGSEPGGGGYLAQRMLAAKDEKHATGAVLFFNVAHYALRPWPWILVALASLVVFPNFEAIAQAFPAVDKGIINDDLAYPAMLTFLPSGWLGLVLASLMAAYMSTISTHLNWGSSYVVNDFYKRFINPGATEKQLVTVGRLSTILMMILAAGLALSLTNALQAFQILLQIGAGTGLIFILRWFWWRINAFSEITAMVVSFIVALTFLLGKNYLEWEILAWQELLLGVAITTACWLTATFITRPTENEKLRSFITLVNPAGPGWSKVRHEAAAAGMEIPAAAKGDNLPQAILCMFLGCVAVYTGLFAVGMYLYDQTMPTIILGLASLVSTILIFALRGQGDPAGEEGCQ